MIMIHGFINFTYRLYCPFLSKLLQRLLDNTSLGHHPKQLDVSDSAAMENVKVANLRILSLTLLI